MSREPVGLRSASLAGYASLLTSAGTLICCTLPAVLVTVGAGAVLATAVSAFPGLVWLSEHKAEIFGVAAVMLLVAGVLNWRGRRLPCPTDPSLAVACIRTRRTSGIVYAVSLGVFAVGALFAFVLPWLREAG